MEWLIPNATVVTLRFSCSLGWNHELKGMKFGEFLKLRKRNLKYREEGDVWNDTICILYNQTMIPMNKRRDAAEKQEKTVKTIMRDTRKEKRN